MCPRQSGHIEGFLQLHFKIMIGAVRKYSGDRRLDDEELFNDRSFSMKVQMRPLPYEHRPSKTEMAGPRLTGHRISDLVCLSPAAHLAVPSVEYHR